MSTMKDLLRDDVRKAKDLVKQLEAEANDAGDLEKLIETADNASEHFDGLANRLTDAIAAIKPNGQKNDEKQKTDGK